MTHIFITDSDFANTDSSFCYLLGFQPSLGVMILKERELIVLLDGRYFSKTKTVDVQKIKDILGNQNLEVSFIKFTNITEKLISLVRGTNDIIMEDNIAIKYYHALRKAFPKTRIEISMGYFTDIKILKNKLEKQSIKKAIAIIDNIFLFIEALVESGEILGKTELQIRQLIITKIFDLGGEGESFDSIVAFGKNSAIPHHVAGSTIIGNGALLIDMGAKYNGYCSDFTRTLWVGEENKQFHIFQKAYKIVAQAHREAVEKYTPGMNGGDVDELAREVIQDSEYKDLFIHSLGHGLGLDIHEQPRLKKGDKTRLEEGMVFTIEPGIYIEEEFGIRLEDIVFLENEKLVKYTQINL